MRTRACTCATTSNICNIITFFIVAKEVLQYLAFISKIFVGKFDLEATAEVIAMIDQDVRCGIPDQLSIRRWKTVSMRYPYSVMDFPYCPKALDPIVKRDEVYIAKTSNMFVQQAPTTDRRMLQDDDVDYRLDCRVERFMDQNDVAVNVIYYSCGGRRTVRVETDYLFQNPVNGCHNGIINEPDGK